MAQAPASDLQRRIARLLEAGALTAQEAREVEALAVLNAKETVTRSVGCQTDPLADSVSCLRCGQEHSPRREQDPNGTALAARAVLAGVRAEAPPAELAVTGVTWAQVARLPAAEQNARGAEAAEGSPRETLRAKPLQVCSARPLCRRGAATATAPPISRAASTAAAGGAADASADGVESGAQQNIEKGLRTGEALPSNWVKGRKRGHKQTAGGRRKAPAAPRKVTVLTLPTPPGAATSRIPTHDALFVDNVCYWLAAFVPSSWAPVCSGSARAVLGTITTYSQGWADTARSLGQWQSKGSDHPPDRDSFGPEKGDPHYGQIQLRLLKRRAIAAPHRGSRVWFNRWMLHMDILANLYEWMRLQCKSLYLRAKVIHWDLDKVRQTLKDVLDMYDDRTSSD
eukprot:TRINITY_DN13579_c0_g1_i1.p1 TRINITY_DN13579_c0_g1~~TRINITY_DN13579_c0_g1_i1.p1  ORF type:complete len:425 (+),score=77.04 TRINITY_DN13579_c0_g1_i1:79-1275(+)